MDWKALVMSLSTIALSAHPKTRAIAPYVGPAVTMTEELFTPKTGQTKKERRAAKLANAVGLVKIAIASTNAMKPGTVDDAVSDRLIENSISVVVDGANLLHRSPIADLPAA